MVEDNSSVVVLKETEDSIGYAVKSAKEKSIGLMDSEFLLKSIGILISKARTPICVKEEDTLAEVLELLRTKNISSVIVVNEAGKVCGIVTERDCIRKAHTFDGELKRPVKEYMTRDPVTIAPDVTVAFALNLMSHGGFRHLPLVDDEKNPIGIVSARDVIDHLANALVDDIVKLETLDD